MICYRHLRFDDRRVIYEMMEAGRSVREIAGRLQRHPSTIYREVRRNRHLDEWPAFRGYFASAAQRKATARRVRGGKLARHPHLAAYVVERLRAAWSPEQIAGYVRRCWTCGPSVCHETIYQYVYGAEGRRLALWRELPSARRSRRRRYARKPRGVHIPLANMITQRPSEIGERQTFGHWECDLVIFRREHGKANLTSLIERRSRFTMLSHNPSRHSAGVMAGIDRHLSPLPSALRQTITFDRGTEFAAYAQLKARLSMTAYFCSPSAPWQKGSVENNNRRLRRFLPLETDIALISEAELQAIADRMNATPRKCLDYRTPAEVLREQIVIAS
ncbi:MULTISPECIES: IS30 family transposase [Sphingobium]|uniref:IS30 family transposase n=1 Tax=Sphingobium sp. MI1205 TaxID=407020 RepID=UPI00076FF44D|nr:IS30 family transposase [Sphingobium sp. MI1205]AMK18269.1 putative transposase [Sphingobium sp. MI1205]